MVKLILSHPTANNFVREAASRFADEDMLFEFYTCIASFPGSILDSVAVGPLSEIKRRALDTKLKKYTHTWPWLEVFRLIAIKTGLKSLIAHETGPYSVDSVYQNLDKHVASKLASAAKKGVTAVYAYEDAALDTFTKAKALGITCVYDLPIAYWEAGRNLMNEEAERMPAWSTTLGGGIADSPEKTNRKVKELELADIVVVPSQFVVDSLPVWARKKKIVVAPFGTPGAGSKVNDLNKTGNKLRVLFVGSMGQRKGLGDLFEAVKLLDNNQVELVVMGSLLDSMEFYREQLPNFTYEAGRPNEEVLKLMRSCDVFCLPSIVEGRALVMQEAMSQGLPIIITANTGGEDLVLEGETGFLVPIRSPKSIAEKIQWFIEHKNEIPLMGTKAKEHAAQYSWERYGTNIINAINGL